MYRRAIVVQQTISTLQSKPTLRAHEVAQKLNLSRHTIARVLRQEGISFREIRVKIINRRIKELYRASPPLSVKEIAYHLGFSSPSAFSHYVRRHLVIVDKQGGDETSDPVAGSSISLGKMPNRGSLAATFAHMP